MSSEPEDRSNWPDVLRKLAEILGSEVALRLAHTCGGITETRVPLSPTDSHPWKDVLDDEQMAKVCEAFGGERLYLPRGHFLRLAKRQIIELHEQGLGYRQIGLRAGCTERYVRMVLGPDARRRDDPRQGKLFGDD